ncbi:MAG: hypothetical protein JW715_00115 [Sedimentisphaerales bacterium]|nr:hypothetical protein [Sedimentisphaerales bacterium]
MFVFAGVLVVIFAVGCHWNPGSETAANEHNEKMVAMTFSLDLNRRIYEDSTWGDPPQLAIWLRNCADQSTRTVMVTYRTASGDWVGKVECSVALPYWIGFYNRQTGTKGPPTWDNPAADAVTCATPIASWTTAVDVPRGSKWEVFVEVNVSGDFNADFPSFSRDGFTDRYGNGQPSLVYHGYIEAADGATVRPSLLGRTEQYEPVDQVISNLDGITTAKEILQTILVSCAEENN